MYCTSIRELVFSVCIVPIFRILGGRKRMPSDKKPFPDTRICIFHLHHTTLSLLYSLLVYVHHGSVTFNYSSEYYLCTAVRTSREWTRVRLARAASFLSAMVAVERGRFGRWSNNGGHVRGEIYHPSVNPDVLSVVHISYIPSNS